MFIKYTDRPLRNSAFKNVQSIQKSGNCLFTAFYRVAFFEESIIRCFRYSIIIANVHQNM